MAAEKIPDEQPDAPSVQPDARQAPVTEGIVGMSGAVPSTIRPQQYTSAFGWRIGDIAPADTYRALDGSGASTGDVLDSHPGGHATQITVKGCTVSQHARREMDAAGYELEG